MEGTEQFVSLTAEERAELEGAKITDARGCVWLLGVLFGAVLLGLLFLLITFWGSYASWSEKVILIGLPLGFSILAFFLLRRAHRAWGKPSEKVDVVRDLTGGVKKVMVETVTAQNIEGQETSSRVRVGDLTRTAADLRRYEASVEMQYLITIGDKKYEVPDELYYRLKVGDSIETHIAPHSGRIFCRKIGATGEIIPKDSLKSV